MPRNANPDAWDKSMKFDPRLGDCRWSITSIVDWGIDKLSSSQSNFQVRKELYPLHFLHIHVRQCWRPQFLDSQYKSCPIDQWVRILLNRWPRFQPRQPDMPTQGAKCIEQRSATKLGCAVGLKSTMLIVIFYKGQLRYQQHRKMVVWFLTSELDQLILYYGEIESNWNQNETPWEDVGPEPPHQGVKVHHGSITPVEFTRCS